MIYGTGFSLDLSGIRTTILRGGFRWSPLMVAPNPLLFNGNFVMDVQPSTVIFTTKFVPMTYPSSLVIFQGQTGTLNKDTYL